MAKRRSRLNLSQSISRIEIDEDARKLFEVLFVQQGATYTHGIRVRDRFPYESAVYRVWGTALNPTTMEARAEDDADRARMIEHARVHDDCPYCDGWRAGLRRLGVKVEDGAPDCPFRGDCPGACGGQGCAFCRDWQASDYASEGQDQYVIWARSLSGYLSRQDYIAGPDQNRVICDVLADAITPHLDTLVVEGLVELFEKDGETRVRPVRVENWPERHLLAAAQLTT